MKCEDIESLFLRHVQQGASFVSFPVTKPVVTKSTMRCYMKDNIIFKLIPHCFSGLDTTATQSLAFFCKKFQMLLAKFAHQRNPTFGKLFFKWLRFLDISRYVLT